MNRIKLFLISLCVPALLLTGCAGKTAEPDRSEADAETVTSASAFGAGTEPQDRETEAAVPPETLRAETESAAEEPVDAASYVYRHVAIIGVDGGGAYFKDADMPELEKIFADGARTWRCHTSEPTISAQCWGSLMTGVTPECHRLSNSLVSSTPYDVDSPFPTFFRVVREALPDAVLGSFCNWNPINVGIVEDGLDVTKGTAPGDSALTDLICKYVKNEQPTVLFVQFDEADGAGHSSGFGGKQQLAQLAKEDGYIARIHKAYEEAGMLDDTLFIVTADHGGNGTSHGGLTDGEKYIMWAAAGKTVIPGGEIPDLEIRDTAAVVLQALGLQDRQPESWTARVPSGLFEGVEAGERPVYTITYAYGHRTHESVPTPDPAGDGSLVRLFGEKRMIAYLPFDGDTESVEGVVQTEKTGKLYFVDGYFGSGAQFDDGYVTLSGYQPEKGSFSAAFWMKTGGVSSDPSILSNKNWDSGLNSGFVLSLRDSDVKFNLGDMANRMDVECQLPIDYKDGWVYVAFTVDRDKNVVRFSYDFGPFQTTEITKPLADATFKGLASLNIGQDGTGRYGHDLAAVLDEFILLDGVLTDEDLDALKAHYGN